MYLYQIFLEFKPSILFIPKIKITYNSSTTKQTEIAWLIFRLGIVLKK